MWTYPNRDAESGCHRQEVSTPIGLCHGPPSYVERRTGVGALDLKEEDSRLDGSEG